MGFSPPRCSLASLFWGQGEPGEGGKAVAGETKVALHMVHNGGSAAKLDAVSQGVAHADRVCLGPYDVRGSGEPRASRELLRAAEHIGACVAWESRMRILSTHPPL